MKSILSLSILICFTVTVYTQEVSVKDADNNVLMEIYDHGRTGSIFLKEGVILLTGFEDKLYNVSGKLYWNGLKLGTATEAAGWTLNGSNLYPTTLSTKVGIGTITPSHSFQVEGTSGNDITMALSNLSNSGYTQLLFGTEPTSDGSILLFGSSHLGSANKFRFRNNRGGGLFDWWLNGGVKMSLNRNGLLDVAGSMKIGNDGVTSSAGTMRYNAATQKFEGHNGIGWNTFGGAGKWSENGSDIYYNNGNVGIGTSSPGSMLHLYGNTTSPVELTIQNQDNAGSERIDFGISHSEQATIQVYGSSHALYPGKFSFVNKRTNAHYEWITGGTAKMTMDSIGHLGIGTTTPSSPIHVLGDNVEKTGYFANNGSTGFAYAVHGIAVGTDANTNIGVYGQAQGDTTTVGVTGFGQNGKTNYGGYFTATSPDTNYAVYATVNTGSVKYAGYFEDGDVVVENGDLGIGTLEPSAKTHVIQEEGGVDAFRVDDELNDTSPFVIKSTGATGIGTTIPMAKMHIIEETVNDAFRVDDETGDLTPFLIKDEGKVGIGTTTPTARLHVADTSGVLFEGTYGVGSLPASSSQSRLVWYPAKVAFRVGYTSGSQWDDVNIGEGSIAMGVDTEASGIYSTAIGVSTVAIGGYSTSMGWGTSASGDQSTSMGWGSVASGDRATATGWSTTASGSQSSTMGRSTIASGDQALAMGWGSVASGDQSTAMGKSSIAAGYSSTAMGLNTKSMAFGNLAIGRYNIGNGNNTTWLSDDPLFEVGNGIDDSNRNNAFTVFKNGNTEIDGDLDITGAISKSSGTFKIDHPLDPENKYLYHSFVESPDMMNVYNGNVITGVDGYAMVEMPEYFEALNKDFRYQLTVIGDFAQAIISKEISNNNFEIRTDKPNIKVSWQVTGIRKDAYAEKNRIQVEVDKEKENRGSYLHPEAYGKDEALKEGYHEGMLK